MPEYVTISDAMIKATQAVKELKLRNETLEAGLNTAIDQLDILLQHNDELKQKLRATEDDLRVANARLEVMCK